MHTQVWRSGRGVQVRVRFGLTAKDEWNMFGRGLDMRSAAKAPILWTETSPGIIWAAAMRWRLPRGALQRSRGLVLPFGLATHRIAALFCQCGKWRSLDSESACQQPLKRTVVPDSVYSDHKTCWADAPARSSTLDPQRLSLWSRR